MHIFILQKAFDTLFDTHFPQELMRQKCLNMRLYATFKEILRVSRFTLKQILTQILLQEYLCSLYIATYLSSSTDKLGCTLLSKRDRPNRCGRLSDLWQGGMPNTAMDGCSGFSPDHLTASISNIQLVCGL